MAEAFQIVKEGRKRDIERRTKAYSNTPPDEFTVGKKVLVFTASRKKHTSDEIQIPWHGPFVISEKLSNILYRVNALPGGDKPPAGIISLSRMKIFNESPTEKGSVFPPRAPTCALMHCVASHTKNRNHCLKLTGMPHAT